LVKAIIRHREFKKIYPTKEWTKDSESYLSLFDLHLIIYRSIKEETETKISMDVTLEELQSLGLLKSYKYPFFIFQDNRDLKKKIPKIFKTKGISLKEEIINGDNELFLIYQDYLPRTNSLHLLKSFPDLENFYNANKKGVNQMNRFLIDPLISENEVLDWFIYDDESLNFLIDAEKIEQEDKGMIFFSSNNKIYLQDKYPDIRLTVKEYTNLVISLSVGDVNFLLIIR
jgi:hypothetical protein